MVVNKNTIDFKQPLLTILHLCSLIFSNVAVSASRVPAHFETLPQASGRKSSHPHPPVITEEPNDWLVQTPETNVRLDCRAAGYPEPKISWLKDGIPLNEAFVQDIVQLTTCELTFLRVIDEGESTNTGIYQCLATNDLGTALSRNASVQIANIHDDFRKEPRDTVGAIANSVTIECEGPRGIPEPNMSWRKDGRALSALIPRSRFRVKARGDLVIIHLQQLDTGSYECVASNSAGERVSTAAMLMVQEPPTITVRPIDRTIQAGQSVEIQCDAKGDPRPSIQWSRVDGVLPERSITFGNGKMRLVEAEIHDSGEYECAAVNQAGMDKASAVITVQENLKIAQFSQHATARSGDTVSFPCTVRGTPSPTVIWRSQHYDKDMQADNSYQDGHFYVATNGKLVIQNVRFDDDGLYVCQGSNSFSSVTEEVKLTVKRRQESKPPPVIRRGPTNVSVSLNSDVTLECSTRRIPQLDSRWYKEGKLVETGLVESRVVKQTSGNLKIFNIQMADSGQYSCKVSNDYGMSEWKAWVTVTAQEDAITPTTKKDLPRAPGKPVLVNSTSSYLFVTWKPSPSTGDFPIDHYILEYYRLGSASVTWSRISPIMDNIYKLRHLPPSSDYVFVVRATNQHGMSYPSPVSKNIRTMDPMLYHQAPFPQPPAYGLDNASVVFTQALPLANPGARTGSIRLKWDTNSGCDVIDGFLVVAQSVTSTNSKLFSKQVSCLIRTLDLPDLISGIKYEVRIRPFKDHARGSVSPIAFVALHTGMIDAVPPLLIAKTDPKSEEKMSLLWQPPRDLPAAYVSGYVLTCRSQDGTFSRTIKVNSSSTEVTLTLVRNIEIYDSAVTYFTQLGEGVTSNKATIILPAVSTEVPDAEEGSITTLFQQPAVIAGCAIALLAIIAIIVGAVCYQKARRKCNTKGVNGSRRTNRFDPTLPFDAGFQITKNVSRPGNLGTENIGPDANRSVGHGISSRAEIQNSVNRDLDGSRNTMVTYNTKNGEIGNYVNTNPPPFTHASQTSFSYVTNQLTCKSDIPPQFSRPNLPAQTGFSSQQLRHQHLMAKNNNMSHSESNVKAGHYHFGSTNSIRGTESLPPPPPSPPLSQRTWISDRSHVSSNLQSMDDRSSRSGQRSRHTARGNKLTSTQVAKQLLTDTDTGIDSPLNTPSTTRPDDIQTNGPPFPPTPPVRGSSNFHYGHPTCPSERNRDATSSLGYLGGPSEGDTDYEYDRFSQMQGRSCRSNLNPRNDLPLPSPSNLNGHFSEPRIRNPSYDYESVSSGEESFHMESASQVGQNFFKDDHSSYTELHVLKPHEQAPIQQPPKMQQQNYPLVHEDYRRKLASGMSKSSKKHAGKTRRVKNSSSSLHHMTNSASPNDYRAGNIGISSGIGCSTEQRIICGDIKSQGLSERPIDHCHVVQGTPSCDITPTNQNVDKLPRLELDFGGALDKVENQGNVLPCPASPSASGVSDRSAYFSTASSCLTFKPQPCTNQHAQSRSHCVALAD